MTVTVAEQLRDTAADSVWGGILEQTIKRWLSENTHLHGHRLGELVYLEVKECSNRLDLHNAAMELIEQWEALNEMAKGETTC